MFGGGIGSKIRAGRSSVKFFGSGGPESTCASQSAPSERKEWVYWDRTTASSRIMLLFIDCEIVHA